MAGAWTVNVVLTERTPTVAVIVAGPKGASGSMVTISGGNTPPVPIVKISGAITPGGPIMTPAVPASAAGKFRPVIVTAVPRAPAVGTGVMLGSIGGGGMTVKVALAE